MKHLYHSRPVDEFDVLLMDRSLNFEGGKWALEAHHGAIFAHLPTLPTRRPSCDTHAFFLHVLARHPSPYAKFLEKCASAGSGRSKWDVSDRFPCRAWEIFCPQDIWKVHQRHQSKQPINQLIFTTWHVSHRYPKCSVSIPWFLKVYSPKCFIDVFRLHFSDLLMAKGCFSKKIYMYFLPLQISTGVGDFWTINLLFGIFSFFCWMVQVTSDFG